MRTTIVLLLFVAALGSCNDFVGPNDPQIRLVPDSLLLLIGEQGELRVEDIPSDALEWSSYGQAIAHVDGSGAVTGVGSGTTAIVARHRDALATARIIVLELPLVGVAAGRLHSCGWEADGPAYCWGYNSYGQLGNDAGGTTCGDFPCEFKPAPVEGGLSFSAITTGDEHSCGITTGSRPYCWGANEHGQLGIGTTGKGATRSPRPVNGDLLFSVIEAGARHTCALTPEGQAYCWGQNDEGQLGDGTQQSRAAPLAVGGNERFEALAAGRRHTCGLAVSGTVYCWGRNSERQLGNGTSQRSSRPVPISGTHTMVAIAAGENHTCALSSASVAFCWGANGQGQLGDGTDRTRSVPTRVAGEELYTALAAGGSHSCALARGGQGFCWGSNGYRQLGNDDDSPSGSAVPSTVASSTPYTAMDAGWLHSCASTSNGITHCWGYNGAGQLGRPDVTSACISEPVQVCSRRPVAILGSR